MYESITIEGPEAKGTVSGGEELDGCIPTLSPALKNKWVIYKKILHVLLLWKGQKGPKFEADSK